MAVTAGIALLMGAILTGPIADAKHPVVTVNGRTIDRTALRARITLNRALDEARQAAISTMTVADTTIVERDRLLAAVVGARPDPLRSAIDDLVRDELLRGAAQDAGLSLSFDVDDEIARTAVVDLAAHVRVVTVTPSGGAAGQPVDRWTSPPRAGASLAEVETAQKAALEELRVALGEGTTVDDAVAGLTTAGWLANGADRWLPATGRVAGLPDGLVVAARDVSNTGDATIGPVIDPTTGAGAVAIVLARGPGTSPTAAGLVADAHVDGDSLRGWAEARAAERALRDLLVERWRTEPQPQVRVRELVIGSATVEGPPGPYRSFVHLVVGQLGSADRPSGASDEATADALAVELRALSGDERAKRFAALVARANATPRSDPLRASGEIGFFTKDQLIGELAGHAFADGVASGDVIGPIVTVAGPELFLVRARFEGVLDERSIAALVEARTTTDLLALARRISPPGALTRAAGTLWRAEAETIGDPIVRSAYAGTALGARSDPVVLAGEIVVVQPEERRAAPLDSAALVRLTANGFDAWLAELTITADVTYDPEPLPGILIEPSPSASASSARPDSTIAFPSLGATATQAAKPSFPIPTPRVVP